MTPRSLLLTIGLALVGVGCTSTSVGVGVYSRHDPGYDYGRGPFWGYGRDTVIVVPPDGGGGDCGAGPPPEIEPPVDPPIAVPLPEPPPVEAFPDLGMPGDFGGFDAGDFDL